MKVKYCGPAADYSGYGEANRHDIAALVAAGVDVTTEIPRYTIEVSDFGPLGAIAKERENKPIGYQVKILHTTPNVYGDYLEPGKYHVGRVFWETNKLPRDFAMGAQMLDEIWTGSEYNKKAIENAGVTTPIYIVPEAIDVEIGNIDSYLTVTEKQFTFYSIFEWTERKNPIALLTAYWSEFQKEKDVALVIKTYVDNFQPGKKSEIDKDIRKLKRKLGLKHYPDLYLYRQLMDRHQIYRFHKTYDCFISAHRGEGWGIPQMEAALVGNPIISTDCGGIHEYFEDKKSAYLIPWKHAPVRNTRNDRWYTADQKWADIDVAKLQKAMRYVYENRKKAQKVGKCGKELVKSQFALESVGAKMNDRLLKIRESLQPKL